MCSVQVGSAGEAGVVPCMALCPCEGVAGVVVSVEDGRWCCMAAIWVGTPDLSQIENMWSDLKKKVCAHGPFRNPDYCWNVVKDGSYKTDSNHLDMVLKSVPACVAQVKAARGRVTCY